MCAAIVWDRPDERYFETGVSKGVLYIQKEGKWVGVPWNGLISVNESPSGAEETELYADNIKYAGLRSAEKFSATIEAYMYPNEFAECDGSVEATTGVFLGQQDRKTFRYSYVTQIGSAKDGTSGGAYKLHIVYDSTASPSDRTYNTVNDSPDAATLSWETSATPIDVTGYKPTSTITIDSRKVSKEKLATLEAKLYGAESSEPELPDPDEVIAMLKTA